ncbi:MAG: hypothetical protein LBS59_09010 [Puniceicoccales bacterium]|jgi:hypothetical protein|nr:hypothetical protein [Puniceicoccales bacterium]
MPPPCMAIRVYWCSFVVPLLSLKTGDEVDRSGRHGKIRRVEEWKGAFDWDNDLYSI